MSEGLYVFSLTIAVGGEHIQAMSQSSGNNFWSGLKTKPVLVLVLVRVQYGPRFCHSSRPVPTPGCQTPSQSWSQSSMVPDSVKVPNLFLLLVGRPNPNPGPSLRHGPRQNPSLSPGLTPKPSPNLQFIAVWSRG